MIFQLAVLLAVTLPFVFVKSDRARTWIYLTYSVVPGSLMLIMYLSGEDALTILMLGIVFTFPLSLLLTAIGIALVVRARSRKKAWRGLAVGTFLASIPIVIIISVVIWTNL